MAVFNLDENEEIDLIKINGVDYEVGDIPIKIIEKIMQIKIGIFRRDLVEQWKPICKEILEIRNGEIDIDNITKDKILAFINYIKGKIQKGQLG